MAYPNANLLDFWKTLWHVDVHKDHGNTYDANIVNSFLPEGGKYTTTQEIDGFKISSAGQKANRNGGDGKMLGFAELFKYLSGINFSEIQSRPIGYKSESILNETLMGKQVKYQIEVFNDDGTGVPSKLSEFIGPHDIALFVDTSSHLPELLENYGKDKKAIYGYTREIESDPADKTTYLTIGKPNQDRFFYELEAPNNPTIISYPPYTKDDPMSYFYCKYPVFLSNNGIREPKKYNLNSTLSYVRNNGNTITVTDGANTAGAFDKFKNGLKKVLGIGSDKDMKEIVFISKHHGDVAQSLIKFRDIQMKCPKTGKEINTADYKATFVSIDVNAIIKALSVETPFIFMYPPDKKHIIVWKNNSLNSPKVQFESEKRFTQELQTKLLANIETYNTKVLDINNNRELVLAKIQEVLTPGEIESGKPLEYYAEKYKEILKVGVHIATLLDYVPEEELVNIDPESANKEAEIASITSEGKTDEEILTQIRELKEIQKFMARKEAELVIPANYQTVSLQGGNLEAVSFEKELIVEFQDYKTTSDTLLQGIANTRITPAVSFKKGNKRVDYMWEVVNLAYNIGDVAIDTLACRFGTKLNNSWAFDLIHYIYHSLSKEYKTTFIQTLLNIVENAPQPTKMDTMLFGLNLIGIPIETPIKGGMIETILQKPSQILTLKTNTTKPASFELSGPKSPEPEETHLEITALKTEFNDIIAHLEFIIDIINLYEYDSKIPTSAYELFGLKMYNRFFKRVFGPQYEVSGQTLSGLAAIRRREQKGGAYNPFEAKLIEEVFESEGRTYHQELKDVPVFDSANYLTTQFSILNLYEEIVSKENEEALKARINRIASLRPSTQRTNIYNELNEKVLYIRSLLTQIKNEETKTWESYRLTGKKRARENNFSTTQRLSSPRKKQRTLKGGENKKKYKFKTFKKRSKTSKRKTQRR